ncbi:hypothetical protein PVA17_24270 [Lysinibacillus sp. CNPSo 3705]|uniref:hypothetical protein n=1 Tax=Lysinibacillus sp. CNPSo 3705 TaxID=3028148 RepID=UPI002363626A|nr:hypothetical protein [Lysinibacillus sp. CNPSo 3705]MDD1505834.1 hypothetical protein [Lysinibacillus sp. CNPSo 3705]
MTHQVLQRELHEWVLQCRSSNNLLSPSRKKDFYLRRVNALKIICLNLPYTSSKKKLLIEHATILLEFISERLDRSMTIPVHINEISEETNLAASRVRTVFRFLEAVRILNYSKGIVSIYKVPALFSSEEH